MWLKYDTFILRLNQISYGSANFPATANVDNQVIINMSGLNFINSTYRQKTGNNTNKYQMLICNIAKNLAQTFNYSPNISLCNFKKGNDNVELVFELIRCIDGLPPAYGVDKFPHMVYSFDIYPIN